MNIEQALKVAHAANIVHFPQGLTVMRGGTGFTVQIVGTGDKPSGPVWQGKTADDAVQAMLTGVEAMALDYITRTSASANRTISEVNAALGISA